MAEEDSLTYEDLESVIEANDEEAVTFHEEKNDFIGEMNRIRLDVELLEKGLQRLRSGGLAIPQQKVDETRRELMVELAEKREALQALEENIRSHQERINQLAADNRVYQRLLDNRS